MVAHPDDCVIFAYSFVYNHATWNWTIGYLTHDSVSLRALEMKNFWNKRNVATVFLEHTDNHLDIQTGSCSFDTDRAHQDILDLTARYDIILTHDQHGDYGHLHHKFVNQSVLHHNVITFDKPQSSGVEFVGPDTAHSINELPIHGKIVSSFHGIKYCNRYNIPTHLFSFIK